jgi:hypothetical protein
VTNLETSDPLALARGIIHELINKLLDCDDVESLQRDRLSLHAHPRRREGENPDSYANFALAAFPIAGAAMSGSRRADASAATERSNHVLVAERYCEFGLATVTPKNE